MKFLKCLSCSVWDFLLKPDFFCGCLRYIYISPLKVTDSYNIKSLTSYLLCNNLKNTQKHEKKWLAPAYFCHREKSSVHWESHFKSYALLKMNSCMKREKCWNKTTKKIFFAFLGIFKNTKNYNLHFFISFVLCTS